MTQYVVFEQEGVPRDQRLYDAGTMLERLASFYADDNYAREDFLDRCEEAWEAATDDDN